MQSFSSRLLFPLIGMLWMTSPRAESLPSVERDDLPVTVMETLVVSGVQPGPGLWKVSKDDHVMWVLGTIRPLPKRMQWNSAQVEQTIAESQQVLLKPSAAFNADVGFFGGMMLLPSLFKARNNPEKETLEDVLPADVYQRWLVLKQHYFGRSRSIEKRRPIVAADKLEEKALKRAKLSNEDIVAEVVERSAKKNKVPMSTPSVSIKLQDPKALLKEFNKTSLNDIECFRRTMERFESDLEIMKLRANAWALGELGILQSLPNTDSFRACADAVLQTEIARSNGFDNIRQQVDEAWLSAAEEALGTHTQSFALLPMSKLLDADGYLAELQRRGYQVEAPKSLDSTAAQ